MIYSSLAACLALFAAVFRTCTSKDPDTISRNCSGISNALQACCVFPFLYQGMLHNDCIPGLPDSQAWCATTSNFDRDGNKTVCPHPPGFKGFYHESCRHGSALSIDPPSARTSRLLQCPSGNAIAMLMFAEPAPGSKTSRLVDAICCSSPVFQNISHVISTTEPKRMWELKCPSSYILTGIHFSRKTSEVVVDEALDAIKCSLLIGYTVVYDGCVVMTTNPKKTTANCACCKPDHSIVALQSQTDGSIKAKCCSIKSVRRPYNMCTFEDGMCPTWEVLPGNVTWTIANGTQDHTTGTTSGHSLQLSSACEGVAMLSSMGFPPIEQYCLSMWYRASHGSLPKIAVHVLKYDSEQMMLVTSTLISTETVATGYWTELQAYLPMGDHFQIAITGDISKLGISWFIIDDFQLKPKRFCTGSCHSIGPLGSSSIHDGHVVLWQATCLGPIHNYTSALSGIWEKKGSHFSVIEYLRCCSLPLTGNHDDYKLPLAGKVGGPITAEEVWSAQCQKDFVVTGVSSLNKFQGLYELHCSHLSDAVVNYSTCRVIWAEVRDHKGISIHSKMECPSGMAVVGLFDHPEDNINHSRLGFPDVDAIKCCSVTVSNCRDSEDCHSNGECIATGAIQQCICQSGYDGNGDYCFPTNQVLPPTSLPVRTGVPTPTENEHVTTITEGSHSKTGFMNKTSTPVVIATAALNIDMSTDNAKVHSSIVMVALSVTAAGLVVLILIVVILWIAHQRRKRSLDESPEVVVPMNEIMSSEHPHSYDNNCTGEPEDLSVVCRLTDEKKPRSRTVLSVEHAYVAEEDLDTTECEPFYFVLDAKRKRSYSLCVSLALPDPMYGVVEQDFPQEGGARFCQPASNEQELYHQLSSEIPCDSIKVGEERLGSGAFGHVMLGVWLKSPGNPVQVAVKMLRDSSDSEDRVKFLQEAAIMRQFTHRNVVYMYGVVTNSNPIMIVLEHMSLGNLRNYLLNLRLKYGKEVVLCLDTRSQLLGMIRDIAAGMQYLHSLGFVHRDLAARNILLDSDMICKIGDFGMSRDLMICDYYTSRGGRIPVKWTAPEAINYGRYSSASDVWSYGVLLFEIWSLGDKPYANLDNNEVVEAVSRGYRLPPPDHCPTMIYRLMVDCWHPEGRGRPRSGQIHHCLCFTDNAIFLDRPLQNLNLENTGREAKESTHESSVMPSTEHNYSTLKHVYAIMEGPT
ncbi:uncharacterized protein LOC5509057 isoform X2 [Nematostella vectensis]|uniref:uncharacterized protein LOC5509057 isoform X2 n=1 Tax=Nematostella vectensis TaxID=45351 RepID=UPI002076DD65|nr:uncharacterized protein LOC5509057 isoform X2 [Nematostella vectensis]